MSDHYFSENPLSKSEPIKWTYQLRNHSFTFLTDTGVFSKKEVDFGSRLLIETFVEPEVKGDILDIGCGYGPIGLALAKTNPDRTVYMVDVNKRALSLAEQNASLNRVNNVVVMESNLYENVPHYKFAAIVTNPPIRAGKKVVHQILEDSFHLLEKKGSLWVVIQKKQGAPSAQKKLESIFEEVEVVKRDKGYYILKATR
jgi:16S rRNA (guanine1207-N2)-methyltransferase